MWISLNLSNALFSKLVSVVCVIDLTSTGPNLNFRKPELRCHKYGWLNLLGDVFKDFQTTITILVKIKGSENVSSTARKSGIREYLVQGGFEASNIIFQRKAPKVGDDPGTRPFALTPREKPDMIPDLVKVILFGKTGSGKSSLAQMLTLERLDPSSKVFPSSSGVDQKNLEVRHDKRRGWYVVDTPGLGKLSGDFRSTSTRVGAIKIFEQIQFTHGSFTHFIYVSKRDRFDMLEEAIWKLFMQIFGEHIKSNFTVVITNSDQGWVDTRMETLRETFTDCESFLSANFPKLEPDDNELEQENCTVRMKSLQQLKKGLANLDRHPVELDYKMLLKMSTGHGKFISLS
ncbi:unnamed protein product [Calypogeia fissa]